MYDKNQTTRTKNRCSQETHNLIFSLLNNVRVPVLISEFKKAKVENYSKRNFFIVKHKKTPWFPGEKKV